MLASLAYIVRSTWRQPWILVVYLLIYWGRTLFWATILGALLLRLVGGHGAWKAALVLSVLGVGAAFFNLGFHIRDLMPGPTPGRRR